MINADLKLYVLPQKKTRSALENIAGIKKFSITINDNKKNLDPGMRLINQEINDPTSIKRDSKIYRSNSSRLSIDHTCILATYYEKTLLLLSVAIFVGSTQ